MDFLAIPLYALAGAVAGAAWIYWRSLRPAYPPADRFEGDEVLLED
jgi:hypothetical protein